MNIVFMGTSDFAVPSLNSLIKSGHQVVGVITQPDRRRGRGKKIHPTPIKIVAQEHGIPISQPQKIKTDPAVEQVKAWQPELIVVVSYGQIITRAILQYPRLGCINVHASLLPRYRGAAPIQRAIMNGEKTSGVTTMFMDEGLDTGDIILQLPVTIEDDYDHGCLETILAEKGAELLIETIDQIEKGTAPRIQQDNELACYASQITSEDERIDWSQSAISIHNRIRALSPDPGASFSLNGYKIKVFRSKIQDSGESGEVASIVAVGKDSFKVQSGQGVIEILEVQKQGKRRMSARDFLQGNRLKPGTILS